MKVFFYFVVAFSSLTILSSCNNQIYSDREKSLFVNPIFGHHVSLDSIKTIEDLVAYFDKIYCEESSENKWPILYFDLEKKILVNPADGKNILAIGIEPAPCPDVMFQYDYSRILEIVKDGYNIAVEEVRIEPDSVAPYISKQYLNYGKDPKYSLDPASNGIWFITNKDDELANLNKYIAQVIEGYVQMIQEYSNQQFEKPIDKLSKMEFQKLNDAMSFHLSFKFSDEPPQVKVGY